MGTWVHGLALMNHIANQIRDNLTSSLSLKFVSVGKLYQLGTKASHSDNFPCVFVSIDEEADINAAHVGIRLVTVYPIRVVYARQFGDDEKVEEEKATAIEAIANDLMDNRDLDGAGLTLVAGLYWNARLSGIEYTAPEEADLRPLSQNIVVAAVTFMAEICSSGS